MALCFVTNQQDSALAKLVSLAFSAAGACSICTTSARATSAAASVATATLWARWQGQFVTTFLDSVSVCLSVRGEGVMSVNQVRKSEGNPFDVVSFALLGIIVVPTVFNMCLDSFMSDMSLMFFFFHFFLNV